MITLLLALSSAHASDFQELRYTVMVDGQDVGHRTLTVRYIPTGSGDLRLLETWTELAIPLPTGRTITYKQRMSGKGDAFVAVINEDGTPREVQVSKAPGGWNVVTRQPSGEALQMLDDGSFDLSSLALFDPGYASVALADKTQLRVLTEIGEVMSGSFKELGATTVTVNGQSIPATEYVWASQVGQMRLSYDADGYLVRYSTFVMGKQIAAELDAMPGDRSWGSGMDAPVIGGGVTEVEL